MHRPLPKRAQPANAVMSDARREAITALIADGYVFDGAHRQVHNAQEAEFLAAARIVRLPD